MSMSLEKNNNDHRGPRHLAIFAQTPRTQLAPDPRRCGCALPLRRAAVALCRRANTRSRKHTTLTPLSHYMYNRERFLLSGNKQKLHSYITNLKTDPLAPPKQRSPLKNVSQITYHRQRNLLARQVKECMTLLSHC